MSTLTTILRNRRRLLTWLGGILLSYSLLGFFLLPWLVESQLQKLLDERLDVSAEVEKIYFNPFSFYFELENLQLTDPTQDALLNLGKLQLNFQTSRLVLLKLQFAEIRIADLDIYYTRDSVEDDTFTRLLERWSSSAEALASTPPAPVENDESSDLIPLEVLSLTLTNIRTHIVDSVPATPFATTTALAHAQIDNFSTLPGESGNNTLSINLEGGARLDWSGDFSVNPLNFQGQISLRNFSLLAVSRYLQDTLPFQLEEGHVNLSLSYDIDLSQEQPRILVDDIDLGIHDIAATELNETEPFISAAMLSMNGGRISIPENRAEFSTLALQDVSVNAVRNEAGLINLLAMADTMAATADATAQTEEASEQSSTSPWFFSLDTIAIENNRVSFLDNTLETPFLIATSIDANMTGIDNLQASQFPIAAQLSLDSGGEIELRGGLQALPDLELASTLSLSDISIAVAQPYVSEFAFLELESGSLNLDANIAVNPAEPFSFTGGISLNNLEISDQQLNETLFSITALGIDAVSLSLAENNIDVSEVSLQEFFASVLIHEDGTSNISRSIKPSAELSTAETVTTEEAENSEALVITVGRVSLLDASANFTDRNLPLPFNANIQNLQGTVQGFANISNQVTDINLEGQVDEFGLVQIISSLNPFDFAAESQIDANFSNIDMPSMTPYVIKFAGREIAEGKVDVDLSYSLLEGELDANNQVVLSALQLGQRVDQPDAMDLPLDLAIALLKDGNGVIDLEVPITGNVNDPEFNFGPAIRRAITNILGNLVAAPFRLLANLVGGGDEGSLEQIRFLPGRADIAAPEQEVLLQLSEALKQRPQLLLEVPAISAEADKLALQTMAVDANIESALEAQAESTDSLTVRRMAAVELLYAEAALPVMVEEIRVLHTTIPEVAAEDSSADVQQTPPGQLDTLAYIADLRDRLIAAKAVGAAELNSLGSTRRDAVTEFLTTRGGITADRLLELEPQSSEQDEDGWLILHFGLTAQ